MTQIVRREVRKRGFFGWIFLLIFVGWNVLMVLWLIASLNGIGQQLDTSTNADATAVGNAIGMMFLIFVWAAGSLIFGLLAILTRGSKVVIEEVAQ